MVLRLTVTPVQNIQLRWTEFPENLSGKPKIVNCDPPMMLPPGTRRQALGGSAGGLPSPSVAVLCASRRSPSAAIATGASDAARDS
jgi:hypothetical protein